MITPTVSGKNMCAVEEHKVIQTWFACELFSRAPDGWGSPLPVDFEAGPFPLDRWAFLPAPVYYPQLISVFNVQCRLRIPSITKLPSGLKPPLHLEVFIAQRLHQI